MTYGRIWSFETRNFLVELIAEPEDCPDYSWDETGEVRQKIKDGEWDNYCFIVRVSSHGHELGEASLGNSIYADPRDFRDHFGRNAKGHGSYFPDMVREAIGYARADIERLRNAWQAV